MTALREYVIEFMQQHPARRLGVAVSGGGDSIALLRILHEIQPATQLWAATVDHGLRAESPAEARFVAETCHSLGISHTILKWRDRPESGNLMDHARRARRDLLAEWGQGLALDAIALGHTQDDVAETFLMRLGRSAGLEGLAEMAQVFEAHDTTWLRPVLKVSRADLRNYCTEIGQGWVDDPTNVDPQYDRANMRHALAALRGAGLGPSQIAASAQHLERARQALAEMVVKATQAHTVWQDGELVMDQAAFTELPEELQRIWLRAAVTWRSGAYYAPRSSAIQSGLSAIAKGKKTTLGGCVIWTQAGAVHLGREYNAVAKLVAAPGQKWDGTWALDGATPPEPCEIRALGAAGLQQRPQWRTMGRPRTTLLPSPALWSGDQLICAPLAEVSPEWRAKNVKNLSDFFTSILSR